MGYSDMIKALNRTNSVEANILIQTIRQIEILT